MQMTGRGTSSAPLVRLPGFFKHGVSLQSDESIAPGHLTRAIKQGARIGIRRDFASLHRPHRFGGSQVPLGPLVWAFNQAGRKPAAPMPTCCKTVRRLMVQSLLTAIGLLP
jgi:hypothetical protein